MNQTKHNGMAAQASRHFLLSADFFLPVLLLALGTWIFRISNLDIAIQSRYFLADGDWALNQNAIARLIYNFGNLPALLLSLGALIVFILGFSRDKLMPYKKISIYLVLSMLLGPGIIVNTVLKDNWGRPRPREITEFKGDYAYEAPLTIDPSSPGKSFPCGHATMGYYFFALGFVLRGWKRRLSHLAMVFAASWGTLIGWIRIGMGGHFASDVLWAGVIVYLCCFMLYRVLSLDRKLFIAITPRKTRKLLKLHHKILLWALGIVITLGVLIATPYTDKKEFTIAAQLSSHPEHNIYLNMEIANLRIIEGEQTLFSFQNNGFGFPGSKLKTTSEYVENGFNFHQWKKGRFTELNCSANLIANPQRVKRLVLIVKKGEIRLPGNLIDTLYVHPNTLLSGKTYRGVIVRKNESQPQGWWFDAPLISFY